ncbi:heme utilization protein [Pseudomonas frederiksbergensis]|uniref:heme utilization protein n=1 Tax=Pseudomonas frederiksbergensis TaxID=104087 RepID=UPI000F4A9CDB|nr:heme utilization protein [Pseudomonas frederiksbergensis]RON59124.1 heme utilization protein [Pseudomonas frederiksbergensis]
MKPSMAIKPLVFAIAAVMAVAVQAGQSDDHHNGHHNGHNNNGQHTPPPTKIPVYATANAWDTQSSTDNRISNAGTVNSAEMNNSATGTSGNVGVNVAGGDGNQQDNAAAIANAAAAAPDNAFVFGNASATASVTQTSRNNRVDNYGSQATASMSGSANGGSGNMGVNVAAGDLNQQKNTMAIANTNAPLGNATATASAEQTGPGLTVNNSADRTYRVDTLTFTTSASGSADYAKASAASGSKSSSSSFDVSGSKSFDASGSKSFEKSSSSSSNLNASLNATLDASAAAAQNASWDNGYHHSGSSSSSSDASLTASLDATLDVSVDKSHNKSGSSSFDKSFDSSFEKSGSKSHQSEYDKQKAYAESSSYDLSNSVSYQVLTPTGWANPVTNTATLSGSVNGGSGNLGVNVAAGVGNQQSNSLAISNNSF